MMWPFKSGKTLLDSGIFQGFTDCHSHILPDVDDGVKTLKRALQVLEYYEQLGISEVWLTPHIMEEMPNTPEQLKQSFDELCSQYSGSVKLRLSAEHMLDAEFEQRLSSGGVVPYGPDGDMLLVETSYFTPPYNMDGLLEKVNASGLFPVLAHPERYVYMTRDDYSKYSERGVRFQLNLLSLTGMYGEDVRKNAEWLLKNNMYSFKGIDLHSLSAFQKFINVKTKVKCI